MSKEFTLPYGWNDNPNAEEVFATPISGNREILSDPLTVKREDWYPYGVDAKGRRIWRKKTTAADERPFSAGEKINCLLHRVRHQEMYEEILQDQIKDQRSQKEIWRTIAICGIAGSVIIPTIIYLCH